MGNRGENGEGRRQGRDRKLATLEVWTTVPSTRPAPGLAGFRFVPRRRMCWNTRVSDVVRVPIHVRDLTSADLPHCAWSGSPTRLRAVALELDRVAAGVADYLAVCAGRTDRPVAIGGVDYEQAPGAGTIHQLATLPALQSCGMGTVLIGAAEDRIRAELGVEYDNPRARALYERLGYIAFDSRPDAWDEEAPDGTIRRYETVCTIMAKDQRI